MSDSYKNLIVWRRAMELVVYAYRYTQGFPKQEMFGLTSQMRRAAVSIPSNIAEGKGRYSRKELTQFLLNARWSLLELETQIEIAQVLGYANIEETNALSVRTSEVGRLLNGMIQHFKQPIPTR